MQLTEDGSNIHVRFSENTGIPVSISGELSLDGCRLSSEEIFISGNTVVRVFFKDGQRAAAIRDEFRKEARLLVMERTWNLFSPGGWVLNNRFSVSLSDGADVMIPSVMYRGNEKGAGTFPRGSGGWSFLETRTPLPSCVELYDGDHAFLCCTEPGEEPDFLSSAGTVIREGDSSVDIRIPGAEFPRIYSGKITLSPVPVDEAHTLMVEKNGLPFSRTRQFFLMMEKTRLTPPFAAYARFIEALQDRDCFSGVIPRRKDWNRYFELKTNHLLTLVEADQGQKTCYLVMGRRNGELQKIYEYTAGSFLVKSLEGALVLARTEGMEISSFLRNQIKIHCKRTGMGENATLSDLAERIGRFFLSGESAPGVHQDCFDLQARVWGGYLGISEHDAYRTMVNARCNGEVMLSYIRLYEHTLSRGNPVTDFLELPKRVAAFYLKNQLTGEEDGSFGRWWSLGGVPVDTLGTNGAYIVSFLCALEPYWEDAASLHHGVEKAGNYYLNLAERGDFFGDTLDADSCDKESGVALLTMFLDLFERDGDRKWLKGAGLAADFILPWIWQYDCRFFDSTPLGSRSFGTSGMTSVSVAHHHLDFYGMIIAYEFLRFREYTGRQLFWKQAVLMMDSCRQLLADEDDLLGRSPEDLGWQPEQINHTRWDYFSRPEFCSGYFDIDIAWVTVLGLGAYHKILRRYPEIIGGGEGESHE